MASRVASGRAFAGALVLVAQLGAGTPGGSPAEKIERSVIRPVSQAPASPVERSPDISVPDRESYAPPSPVCGAASGECSTVPAGVHPLPDPRLGP